MKLPVISWIVCVLALLGLFAWGGLRVVGVEPATQTSGQALVGGDWTLVDGQGNTRSNKDFLGQYQLVYFGFTHCPDICPTSLLLMDSALKGLGEKAKKVTPIFITLDPERDTPEAVGQYVSHFNDRMVGLSGTPEQVARAAEAFKVYYRKVEDPQSAMGYVVDHSGFMYLMGPDGAYITHFPHSISEQSLTDGLNAAIR